MTLKVNSLLVWLLSTTTAVVRVKALCETELAACAANAVCDECLNIDDSFNREFEQCEAAYTGGGGYCDSSLVEACCQHEASDNDCLSNEPFVAAWWCYISFCTITFPDVESCSEQLGYEVSSGSTTGAPAPTAVASGATDAPALTSLPTEGPLAQVPTPTAPGPTSAPISTSSAAPITTSTAAPVTAPTSATPVATSAAPVVAAPVPTASTGDLVEASETTTVTVSANAFDERNDFDGCAPDGCTAENTRDGDTTDISRWSCSAGLLEGGTVDEDCEIVYAFAEAQDVESVLIAFYKGDARTRTLNVNVNGEFFGVIESGGETDGLEAFEVNAVGTLSLGLESVGLGADEFLSITEVEILVSSLTSSPAVAPSSAASPSVAPSLVTSPTVASSPVTSSSPVANPTAGSSEGTPMPTMAAPAGTPSPASELITDSNSESTPTPTMTAPTSTSAPEADLTTDDGESTPGPTMAATAAVVPSSSDNTDRGVSTEESNGGAVVSVGTGVLQWTALTGALVMIAAGAMSA